MTELETLFDSARTTQTAPPTAIDADVARGRQALKRRRLGRTPVVAGAAAVVAVAGFALSQHAATPPAPATNASPTGAQAGIRLVAYTGAQPQGYTVDSVPAGWEIQGVDNYVLAIAPVGDKDTNIDSFEGKLVVMLRSKDDTGARAGDAVTIGSQPGVIDHSQDAFVTQVFYTDAAGHRVDIQVPPTLHWTNAEIVAFAASVHVNATAQAGVG
jgi:hypothetical protein